MRAHTVEQSGILLIRIKMIFFKCKFVVSIAVRCFMNLHVYIFTQVYGLMKTHLSD